MLDEGSSRGVGRRGLPHHSWPRFSEASQGVAKGRKELAVTSQLHPDIGLEQLLGSVHVWSYLDLKMYPIPNHRKLWAVFHAIHSMSLGRSDDVISTCQSQAPTSTTMRSTGIGLGSMCQSPKLYSIPKAQRCTVSLALVGRMPGWSFQVPNTPASAEAGRQEQSEQCFDWKVGGWQGS